VSPGLHSNYLYLISFDSPGMGAFITLCLSFPCAVSLFFWRPYLIKRPFVAQDGIVETISREDALILIPNIVLPGSSPVAGA
jgi:hypothetical protein